MRPNITEPRQTTAYLIACLTAIAIVAAAEPSPVPYPDGFRSWMVVKSLVVGPAHASFPNRGGLHHYYANDKAVAGYRTGTFPDGAIVVDEAVFTKEGEGTATGLLLEGERRFLDVMVKDAERYKSTGGWGYEHFDLADQTGRLTDAEREACATCHAKAPADHVFSRIRP
jgi:Cytochrome P460